MSKTTKKEDSKKVKKNQTKKITKNNIKKTSSKRINKKELLLKIKDSKRNIFITLFIIFLLAILLIVGSYAWFSTTLNVKIHTFNMLVTKNEGLSISHDAVTYNTYIDISKEILFDDLGRTYPGYITSWPSNGLVPVSTNGNKNKNSYFFDVFRTNGVTYPNLLDRTTGVVTTKLYEENKPKAYSNFLAFDIFFRNDSDSPNPDNLYFDGGTGIVLPEEITEQMQGLVNSMRIAIVKVGSLPDTASPSEVQNIKCNNDCEAIIFEPFSTNHTEMAINNAKKYKINVTDGEEFDTYANVNAVYQKLLSQTISGSETLDTDNFKLQETITEQDFVKPLFKVPDGYTKARMYLWIEGQDIDSLETNSIGLNVDVIVNFAKDTAGYDIIDEERE